LPFHAPPARVGLLYFGAQRTHGGSQRGAFQGVLRAALRREGWAALRSPAADPAGAGEFTTAPLSVPSPAGACGAPGAQLWLLLNAAAAAAGRVAVTLLNASTGAPLPGFSAPVPFTGDAVRWPAAWAAGPGGAPAVGTAEMIVDITTTGATLVANGLKVLDDGVIDPRDTRSVLSFCLDTCLEAAARQPRATSFGVGRM
jgi:hypothetical protein